MDTRLKIETFSNGIMISIFSGKKDRYVRSIFLLCDGRMEVIMKKVNMESIVQSVILIITAILLAYGLRNGRINQYVHPRFNIGLLISILVLLLFVISIISDKKKSRHNINLKQYTLFIIPLICAIAFPPITTSKPSIVLADSMGVKNTGRNDIQIEKNNVNNQSYDQLENSQVIQEDEDSEESNNIGASSDETQYSSVDDYLQKTQNSQDTNNIKDTNNINDTNDTNDTQENNNTQENNDTQENMNTQDIQDNQESKDEKKKDAVTESYHIKKLNGSYIIKDDIFADWYLDLYNHLDNFVGERYQFLAQVYSMDGLKDNQFLVGRNFMICCAVDLMQYGIICESDRRSELKDNQWITVTATISKYNYEGSKVPVLKDVIIKKAKKPKVEYIYYNSSY